MSYKPLLFVSFFVGIRGNCPAEWADDKIRVLEDIKREVVVLTGMGSHVADRPGVHFFRVPSLSWNDFKEEIKELRVGGESVPFVMYLLFPFAFIFGNILDFILHKITKGISAGRWSWTITAFPVAVFLKWRYGLGDVFCTGGPMAAHLVGGAVVRLTGGRLFCEFQDPLLGSTMTRSSMTRRIASRIEAWLTKLSSRAVYVTQEAANLSRQRNPDNAMQIVCVYPGAWRFFPPVSPDVHADGEMFEFLHLGTLYGSRNLDMFFDALDALHNEGFELARYVRVVNLGAMYCNAAQCYLSRSDFQSIDALDRIDALVRAKRASALLLIQHTDERSRETIPYKTYDYLNLELPVFGLLNNDELKALIESCGGHAAQADNVEAIKRTLRVCLSDLAANRTVQDEPPRSLDITRQFLQVLECVDGSR